MFVGFGEDIQRRDNMRDWWRYLPIFTTLFFLVSAILMPIQIFLPEIGQKLANIPTLIGSHFQFWRLITATIAVREGVYGFISVFISFWWLFGIFPYLVSNITNEGNKVFIDVLTLLVEGLYALLILGLASLDLIHEQIFYYYSLGWDPLIIIFAFKFTAENPDQEVGFCFLPCLIKRKWIPIFVSLLFAALSHKETILMIVVAFLLGLLQFLILKSSLIRLPLSFYTCFEKLIPNCIKDRQDYRKIVEVVTNLQTQCCGTGTGEVSRRNQQIIEMQGQGVAIGGYGENNENQKQSGQQLDEGQEKKVEKEDLIFK